FTRANQIAGREFGKSVAARTDAARLERRRGERAEIDRSASRFAQPVYASLHAPRKIASTTNGRRRRRRTGSAGGESRTATESTSHFGTKTAHQSGRRSNRTSADQSRAQCSRCLAGNKGRGFNSLARGGRRRGSNRSRRRRGHHEPGEFVRPLL